MMTTRIKKIGILMFAILTAAGIMAMYIANNSAFANNSNAKKHIGEDRAKEIALKDAGVSAADATFLHAHLDRDDRIIDYDVEFYYDGKEYDYEINAYTGDIMEKSVEREPAPKIVTQPPAVDAAPQVDAAPPAATQPSNNTYYYDDDYYDDDWDDRYDDDWDDRYDDDDDDWDDRYDDDDDWDDDWDD